MAGAGYEILMSFSDHFLKMVSHILINLIIQSHQSLTHINIDMAYLCKVLLQ